MQIRPATPDDAAALAGIEREAFDPAHYSGIWGIRQFRRAIAGGRHLVLVACLDDDRPAGYGLGMVRAGSGLVRFYSLAVAGAAKGRGLGEALFHAMEAAAQERGYAGMTLEIRKDNGFLHRRYLSFGYAPYREIPDYYPDGCACIKMKKLFGAAAVPERK